MSLTSFTVGILGNDICIVGHRGIPHKIGTVFIDELLLLLFLEIRIISVMRLLVIVLHKILYVRITSMKSYFSDMYIIFDSKAVHLLSQ
jgi:hypothetical protein